MPLCARGRPGEGEPRRSLRTLPPLGRRGREARLRALRVGRRHGLEPPAARSRRAPPPLGRRPRRGHPRRPPADVSEPVLDGRRRWRGGQASRPAGRHDPVCARSRGAVRLHAHGLHGRALAGARACDAPLLSGADGRAARRGGGARPARGDGVLLGLERRAGLRAGAPVDIRRVADARCGGRAPPRHGATRGARLVRGGHERRGGRDGAPRLRLPHAGRRLPPDALDGRPCRHGALPPDAPHGAHGDGRRRRGGGTCARRRIPRALRAPGRRRAAHRDLPERRGLDVRRRARRGPAHMERGRWRRRPGRADEAAGAQFGQFAVVRARGEDVSARPAGRTAAEAGAPTFM